jgi:hypothetical protein
LTKINHFKKLSISTKINPHTLSTISTDKTHPTMPWGAALDAAGKLIDMALKGSQYHQQREARREEGRTRADGNRREEEARQVADNANRWRGHNAFLRVVVARERSGIPFTTEEYSFTRAWCLDHPLEAEVMASGAEARIPVRQY